MTCDEPRTGYRFDRWDLLVLLGLLALAAAALWPVLRADAAFAPGLPDQDGRTQWYPWRAFAYDSIRHGILPLWNPYILCGVPFVGDFQSALFYPPNLIFAVQPIGVAARASVLFHIWLSMVFTYLFIRFYARGRAACAVGAMVFGLCAAQLLRVPAGHWGVSTAIPWMALTLLCVEWVMRPSSNVPSAPSPALNGVAPPASTAIPASAAQPAAGAPHELPGIRAALVIGAVAVALQVLAGVPQYVFITGIAAAVFALLRGFDGELTWGARGRRWGTVAAMFILGACVGAIQLLPGLEAAMHGARSLPMLPAWVRQFSLAPESLATLLIPGLFGGAEGTFYWGRYLYWEMTAYVGILGLTLAIAGLVLVKPRRAAVWFGATALLMLLLALGRHTPLMTLLAALPFGDMLRGSAKFLLPFSFCLAVLAGIGVQRVSDEDRWGRLAMIAAIVALAAGALFCAAYFFAPDWQRAILKTGECLYLPAGEKTTASLLPIIRGGLTALLLLGALIAAVLCFRRTPKLLAGIVALLVALDGLLFSWSFISAKTVFKAQGSAWPAGAARLLRLTTGEHRVLTMQTPELNDGMIERVPTVEGIEPNPPARFHELFRLGQGQPTNVAPSLYQWSSNSPLILRFGLGHVLGPEEMVPPDSKSRVAWRQEGKVLLDLPSTLPRARVVYQATVARSPEEALTQWVHANAAETVVLEAASTPPRASTGADETFARMVESGVNRVIVRAGLKQPGWLVLLDNDFPGWGATVDGKPADILRADYAFRAVALPPGIHEVVFTYNPPMLRIGFAISLAALLVGALIVITGLKRTARPKP